jgi:hypothetical protein
LAVIGALHNRKTNLIKVTKSKTFIIGAIISSLIVGVGLLFVVVNTFGNFIYTLGYYQGFIPYPDWYIANYNEPVVLVDVIGAMLQIIVAAAFIGAMFIPAAIATRSERKRGINYNSHRKY